jgi:hypothetical protein
MSATYIIDTNNPEMICRVRVNPRRNPMFHMNEIDDGEGRSVRDFFRIEEIRFFLISWVFIRMWRREIG